MWVSIAILVGILTALFSMPFVWRLIPNKVVQRYLQFDRRMDVAIGSFCLFFLLFTLSIIIVSTYSNGPVLLDATQFNEGMLEVITLSILSVVVYTYTLIQFKIVNRRK